MALPLLSQIPPPITQNQPAFGLPMHVIRRIADPSALAFYLTTSYWASHPVEQLSPTTSPLPWPPPSRLFMVSTDSGLTDYFCRPPLPVYIHSALTPSNSFEGPTSLVEGFGPGAYSGAVITNLAFSHASFQRCWSLWAAVAMHIPTLTSCLNHFKTITFKLKKTMPPTQQACSKNVSHRPDGPPPSPKYVLILAQHVRDRRAPWRLNDVLAAHLFNHGIRLITLHDKIEHQRARAETRDLPFVPSSKFGRYRHDYEWLNSLPQVFLSLHATHTLLQPLCLR